MIEAENREKLNRCPVCFSGDFVFVYEKQDGKLEMKDRRLKCNSCGVLFIANRLTPEFIIWKFYQKRNPIGPTEKYLEKKEYLKKIADEIADFLPVGSSVFDIGCGGGALLKFLADKGCKVSGLEVSEQAKEEAERVIGLKDAIRVGDFLETDFEGETFSAVLITDVVEHLHNSHLYFEKISGILKPGGLIVIRTPNSDSLMHKLLKARWTLASPRHITLYNKKSLSYLLIKHNFQIIDFKSEKEIQGKLIPSFSYGFSAVLKGFLINLLRRFFSIIGKGESITILARKSI